MKVTEQERAYQRQLIWNNAFNILMEVKSNKNYKFTDENINILLRKQKRFIHNTDIYGKNKYKSIKILDTYLKSKDKHLAEQVFLNTLKNKTHI